MNACLLFVRHISVGDPRLQGFSNASEKLDLVILARQGSESPIDFGSVAERVVKGAAVPVTIIPV